MKKLQVDMVSCDNDVRYYFIEGEPGAKILIKVGEDLFLKKLSSNNGTSRHKTKSPEKLKLVYIKKISFD